MHLMTIVKLVWWRRCRNIVPSWRFSRWVLMFGVCLGVSVFSVCDWESLSGEMRCWWRLVGGASWEWTTREQGIHQRRGEIFEQTTTLNNTWSHTIILLPPLWYQKTQTESHWLCNMLHNRIPNDIHVLPSVRKTGWRKSGSFRFLILFGKYHVVDVINVFEWATEAVQVSCCCCWWW